MTSPEIVNKPICPHCKAEIDLAEQAWMNGMRGYHAVHCQNCRKTISHNALLGISDDNRAEKRNSKITFFIVFFLLSGLVILLNRNFDMIDIKKDAGKIAYEIIIVLLVSSTLAYGKKRQGFVYLTIWAGIFLLLITGYSYRHELLAVKQKVLAELSPASGFQKTPDSISFPISADGHFHIRGEVDGTPIMFLVDTGASDIVLSPNDAEKIGIDAHRLKFNRFYETANGMVRGGSIRIADFRVGDLHLKEVGASVNEAEMSDSLLGMTFFKRLKRYEVKDDVLTLYWTR
jgi:aspartyl protease family protein